MPSRQMYIDGNGLACIVGYNNAVNARNDPLNNLDDVYLHSSLTYLQFKEIIGPSNVTFSAVNRAYYYWNDGGGGKGGGCFITTACIRSSGKKDDCYELQTLRRFRNKYMFTRFDLALKVMWYYENAPTICRILKKRPDANLIFKKMFEDYIQPSVKAIEEDDLENAEKIYEQGVIYAAHTAGVKIG